MSSCRISWGAIQASEYLLKIVQMKYPYIRVTPQQSAVRIAAHPIDVPLSHLFPVDAPNFLRIFAKLSDNPTPTQQSRRPETSGPHSPIPLCGSRESPRCTLSCHVNADEKSRKRSRRRNSRGWQRSAERRAGVYKKWRLRNERRR